MPGFFSYTFFVVLALAAGAAVFWIALCRQGAPPWRAAVFTALTVAVFPFGARLLFLLTHPDRFTDPLGALIAPTVSHFSLYGGLLASALTALAAARVLRLSIFRTADASVPALASATVLAKSGCFIDQCCPGRPSDLPWAITLRGHDIEVPAATVFGGLDKLVKLALANPVPTHPIAAYEMMAAVAAAGLAWTWGRRRGPGATFLAFVIGFSAARWSIFYLRAGQSPLERTVYPLLYAAVILGATALLFREAAARTLKGKRGRADIVQHALGAERLARDTDGAAVVDQDGG